MAAGVECATERGGAVTVGWGGVRGREEAAGAEREKKH